MVINVGDLCNTLDNRKNIYGERRIKHMANILKYLAVASFVCLVAGLFMSGAMVALGLLGTIVFYHAYTLIKQKELDDELSKRGLR